MRFGVAMAEFLWINLRGIGWQPFDVDRRLSVYIVFNDAGFVGWGSIPYNDQRFLDMALKMLQHRHHSIVGQLDRSKAYAGVGIITLIWLSLVSALGSIGQSFGSSG